MATEFYDAGDVPENAIEWLKGRKTATVTLAGGSALNHKVRRLAKDKPDKCQRRERGQDYRGSHPGLMDQNHSKP